MIIEIIIQEQGFLVMNKPEPDGLIEITGFKSALIGCIYQYPTWVPTLFKDETKSGAFARACHHSFNR